MNVRADVPPGMYDTKKYARAITCMSEKISVSKYDPITKEQYSVPTREVRYEALNGSLSMDAICLMKLACPRRNENDNSISPDPSVNRSANLCGEIITMGRNVKASIIQTTPIAARIANVVNLSFVEARSSIEVFAELSFELAQFINPADSSSFCAADETSAVLADESDEKYDFIPEKIPPEEFWPC